MSVVDEATRLILEDGDWQQAFQYATKPDPARAGDTSVPLHGFSVGDVRRILAAEPGENDGPNWICVGELQDGRYFSLSAGCDYTGWD